MLYLFALLVKVRFQAQLGPCEICGASRDRSGAAETSVKQESFKAADCIMTALNKGANSLLLD